MPQNNGGLNSADPTEIAQETPGQLIAILPPKALFGWSFWLEFLLLSSACLAAIPC